MWGFRLFSKFCNVTRPAALFGLTCLPLFASSAAPTPAFQVSAFANNGTVAEYIGIEINVTVAQNVTSLGVIDTSNTVTLPENVGVGIYSVSPGGTSAKPTTWVTSAIVLAGTAAESVGVVNAYFVPVAPVTLQPGNYVILATADISIQGYGSGTLSFVNGISYVNSWFTGGNITYPGYGVNTTGLTNQGGNWISSLFKTTPTTNTTSSVRLNGSGSPSSFGAPVSFIASVTPSAGTGTVTILDGTAVLGTASVSNGIASYTATSLTSGSHSITAVYSGDGTYGTSTSAAVSQTVSAPPISTATTVTSNSPIPPPTGTPITFTASVSPSTAGGTMIFIDGNNSISGPITIANGMAQLITTSLSPGAHQITAQYSGDFTNNIASSRSAAITQAVFNPIFTDTFTGSASTQWANELGTWSAANGVYDAASPSAIPNAHSLLPYTVTDFSIHVTTSNSEGDGGVWLRSGNISTGIGIGGILFVIKPGASQAYFSVDPNGSYVNQPSVTLTPGPHTYDIVVIGNNYNVYLDGGTTPFLTLTSTAETSGQVGLYENAALGFDNFSLSTGVIATTTTLTASPNPATISTVMTLRAVVSPGSGTTTPQGTMTFYDNGSPLSAGPVDVSGIATSQGQFSAGLHVFTAQFTGNSNFAPSTSLPVNQTIGSATSPVSILTGGLPSGQVGQPYSAGLSATGGSGTYLWSAGALPPGLSVNGSGSITGTPTSAWNSPISVTVTASGGGSATTSFGLTITAAPIVISGNSNLGDFPVGGSVSASFTASGGTAPYRWSLSGASGISVDGSGNVRGSAASAGNFSPSLTVTDSAGGSASLGLSLAVLGISGSLPAGSTTSAYSGSVAAIGGVAPYSYTASGIPQGLSFSGGALTGTPASAGSFTIGAKVTDSKGVSASGSFSLTVTGPAPKTLTITTTSLQDAVVGQPYSQTLGAGGGSPAYTWSLSGAGLPAGFSFSSSGTITGTPTTPGSGSFGVEVNDTAGAEVVASIGLNVQSAPLQITTGGTFPAGLVGIGYPAQILTATGGVAPYSFTTKGTLPAGLALANSSIGGTPTAAGDFGFTVIATDSANPPVTASLAVTGTIRPNSGDLVLSAASASFSLAAGTTAAPAPEAIDVSSSAPFQTLTYSTASSVPWLTVSGGASTPAAVSISLNGAALALTAAGSPYSGNVTLTCTSAPCSGNAQTVSVTLTVTTAPPQLSVAPGLLSFVALTSNPVASTGQLVITNAGGGSLAINSVTAADSWITVSAPPASVSPGPGASLTVTVDPSSLKAGYYTSSITVKSGAGNATVAVDLLISGAAVMSLGPEGQQFSMVQGGTPGNASGNFLISVSSGTASYTATVMPGASWLTGGGTGSASAGSPGTVSFSINPTVAGTLAAGSYYGTIRVIASGVVDSPEDFQVILSVAPAGTPLVPDPEPAGLVFISRAAATVGPQAIQVFASSKTSLAFMAAGDGSSWLSVSPTSGSTSASTPAQVTVSVTAKGLQPGVYRGSVSFSFTGSSVRTVNVTLIVPAPLAGSDRPGVTSSLFNPADATSCSGGQLVPTDTGIASNFSAPAAWPTPLAIRLYDTCGNTVGNGQVVATFSNGDPALPLVAVDPAHGLYSGTWTPRKTSSQITITARAAASGYPAATALIQGQVAPNSAPTLAPGATGDIFHPQVGAGFGPGNIVQIYGTGLASQMVSPTVLPLPTSLNGTQVVIGGITAPLFFVSPGQINAQIPFELAGGNQYQLIVSANGALTTPQAIELTQSEPAVLQFTSGAVVAQHQDGTLISATSPAVPGEAVVIYLSGLGATDIPVPSGSPSPSSPPANVVDTPMLTINGTSVPVLFAGLTPTLVGLYQINFLIPAGLTTGNYTLLISQSGTQSNQTVLAVKAP